MKHTPGPWTVSCCEYMVETENETICTVHAVSNTGLSNIYDSYTREANVNLVSATPEMYNVLEYINAVFGSRSDDNETIPIETMRHVLNLSQKVIAKAKGETK